MTSSLALLLAGQIPERYQRNIGTIGVQGQIELLKGKAAIVGAGGLGGLVLELLTRMGVGQLTVIDGDVFCEHNLNRQLLATNHTLGMEKAAAAAARAAQINPDVTIRTYPVMLNADNAQSMLEGVQVAVDALDNIKTRLLLSKVCHQLGIPLVHAAIAGFTGQVTTVYPGDSGLERLYRRMDSQEKGIETQLGNPAATPALAASIQAQEVIKILTGIGEPLRGKLLYFDTQFNLYELFDLV